MLSCNQKETVQSKAFYNKECNHIKTGQNCENATKIKCLWFAAKKLQRMNKENFVKGMQA